MTIAIIGHGRSPEGRGWGERIDACGTVIRMWDCHWQEPLDYGTQYHIGLFEAHPALMDKFNRLCQREPERTWIASVLGHVAKHALPEPVILVDQAPWVQIGKSMGGVGKTGNLAFTRGTIAALWAVENAPSGETIILVGFDNVYGQTILPIEEAFPAIYVDQPSTFPFSGYVSGGSKHGNHDFGVERPLLERLAMIRGVTLQFAQDVWP